MGQNLCGRKFYLEEGEDVLEGSFVDKKSREEWFFKEDSILRVLDNGRLSGTVLVKNADLRLGTYRPYRIRGQVNKTLSFSYDGKMAFESGGIFKFTIGQHNFTSVYDSKKKWVVWRLQYSADREAPSQEASSHTRSGVIALSLRLRPFASGK